MEVVYDLAMKDADAPRLDRIKRTEALLEHDLSRSAANSIKYELLLDPPQQVDVSARSPAAVSSSRGDNSTEATSSNSLDAGDSVTLSSAGPADRAALLKKQSLKPARQVSVVVPIKRSPKLPYSTLQSGLVYDARMRFHTELPLAKLDDDFHPEDPRRIVEIYNELVAAGLVWDPESFEPPSVTQMWRVPVRRASREEICLVHDVKHYKWLRTLSCEFWLLLCVYFFSSTSFRLLHSAPHRADRGQLHRKSTWWPSVPT